MAKIFFSTIYIPRKGLISESPVPINTDNIDYMYDEMNGFYHVEMPSGSFSIVRDSYISLLKVMGAKVPNVTKQNRDNEKFTIQEIIKNALSEGIEDKESLTNE